jgi:hypothetical protein
MIRKNLTTLLGMALIVAGTTSWVVGHWATHSKVLAELWPLLVGFLVVNDA